MERSLICRLDEDKRNAALLSRLASLAKLKHGPIGYTGPLSRDLLTYQSFGSALRSNLRDLIEMVVGALFLTNDGDRESRGSPADWNAIGLE
jgi:Temperature dependent protein affecting M2 dsRNA replication